MVHSTRKANRVPSKPVDSTDQAPIPRSRYVLFFGAALVGVTADLLTKAWAFTWPLTGRVDWFWDGHIGIQSALNEGALFGFGQGKVWLFAIVSIAAVIALPIWLFRYGAAKDWGICLMLGGVLGGILGNLYDRLGLHGLVWPAGNPSAGKPIFAVRDWILWQYNADWVWPNFNIADSLLVVGALVLVWKSFRNQESRDHGSNETQQK
jgi:signal peptidase II